MTPLSLPIRRPVATAMLFVAIVLLGVIGWRRIAVELLPDLAGDQLFVSFVRPGSEPEVIERELLMPLEARVEELAGVEESWAEVTGSGGTLTVRFEPGVDLDVRELELSRLAAELSRQQPRGTMIEAGAGDLSVMSRFVMLVHVAGGADRNSLRDMVEERLLPQLSAVEGVSRVLVNGGAAREVTVRLDPERCAALGVSPTQAMQAVARDVQRLRFLGGSEDGTVRTAVMLDGRPRGVHSLSQARLSPTSPVQIAHLGEVEIGAGREETLFRVNGQPSVGLVVFQEEGANLVALGRSLRQRISELSSELEPYGVKLLVGFDAAELVEQQLDRLKGLALSGFAVCLLVLWFFLRQLRAVAVVGIAVPVSLLTALALLYLGGLSLNLITLFGLAVGIGMLVDNSIVVYEAVQRLLERGLAPAAAAVEGIRRTVRAIMAATATNAVVFLPIAFAAEDTLTRGLLKLMAIAILLPQAASLLVALGLVPLLAHRLAAPAALARLAVARKRREALAGLVRPDRAREVFGGVLKVALRRPAGWLALVAAAVVVTVLVAVPWLGVSTAGREAPEANEVRLTVEVPARSNLDLEGAAEVFDHLEQAALALDGVKMTQSVIQEEGGNLTVSLVQKEKRPRDLTVGRVREVVRSAAERLGSGVEVRAMGSEGEGGGSRGGGLAAVLGSAPAEVAVSGPDARVLLELAEDIEGGLDSIPEIAEASIGVRRGPAELRVEPDPMALAARGLTPDQVLPALAMVRREGVEMRTGFTLADGREVPLVVRSSFSGGSRAVQELRRLEIATPAGVVPLGELATLQRMPPPATIVHHNGRRELAVSYQLKSSAPQSGPARQALDETIRSAVREVNRPAGYTVAPVGEGKSTGWFKKALVPMLLAVFATLAITFESLTLPVVVLLSVPLTVLGAMWSLVLAGMGADVMVLAGAVTLLGVTVNPAILLVDRMQQRARAGTSAGAAALAAVRERVRPVLMTSCTTIAGLWPLALTTGRENEIWPPFATIMMGGLVTSTLLTLLVIPAGYVLLSRLDRLFGRLGPWVMIGWLAVTVATMTGLIAGEVLTSLTWQCITAVLVAAGLLGLIVILFPKPPLPEPRSEGGPPAVAVRFLQKVYGRPGPIGRALRAGERFAERVLERGGTPFARSDARDLAFRIAALTAGAAYLAFSVRTMWWQVVFAMAAAALAGRAARELRRWRGRCDALGRVTPGGPEGVLASLLPWLVVGAIGLHRTLLPILAAERPRFPPVALALLVAVTAIVQAGRRTAVAQARAEGSGSGERALPGQLRRLRLLWRRACRRVFGFDLPREEIVGLDGIELRADRGMVGVLGPNGAGKTTLLRLLAGIIEPSVGVITVGEVPIQRLRRHLARWVGYLPQDFGLPADLSGREYLEYYALLYGIAPEQERTQRVERLLEEVGLSERAGDRIGDYSGGMRQRLAVARTLLRLPPIIIVDEPTVGLDPRERIRFRNLLVRLAEGRVVLFSTHVVEDVAASCERVVVLARGAIVFDGEPARLAEVARGRVWELRLAAGQERALPEAALVVDEVPEGDGGARLRVLADQSPHPHAVPDEPTLEDGYLQLVGLRHRGAA